MDRHVPSSAPEGTRRAYAASMTTWSALSAYTFALWASGRLTAKQHVMLELPVALAKASGEMYFGELTADLVAHHMVMFTAFALALSCERLEGHVGVLSASLCVHIPLAFAKARLLLDKGTAARGVMRALYLLTWLPAVLFRNAATVAMLAQGAVEGDALAVAVAACGLAACMWLDALWTPWGAYRRHQRAAFLLACALPQAWLWAQPGAAGAAAAQVGGWLTSTVRNVPAFVAQPTWVTAVLALALERITYTGVWVCPGAFTRLCRAVMVDNAVNLVVFLFFVNKAIQAFAFFGWWAHQAGQPMRELLLSLPALAASRTTFQLVTGLQLLVLGQHLNCSIYRAIGKDGVYYGARLGRPVKWATGWPFDLVPHPQYTGAVMTSWGISVLLATPEHVEAGWFGIPAAQTAYYVYMALVESHAPAIA